MSAAAFATMVRDKNQLKRNLKKPCNFLRWSDFLLPLFNNALKCSKTMWLADWKLQKVFLFTVVKPVLVHIVCACEKEKQLFCGFIRNVTKEVPETWDAEKSQCYGNGICSSSLNNLLYVLCFQDSFKIWLYFILERK